MSFRRSDTEVDVWRKSCLNSGISDIRGVKADTCASSLGTSAVGLTEGMVASSILPIGQVGGWACANGSTLLVAKCAMLVGRVLKYRIFRMHRRAKLNSNLPATVVLCPDPGARAAAGIGL